jgi:hypothetical protein
VPPESRWLLVRGLHSYGASSFFQEVMRMTVNRQLEKSLFEQIANGEKRDVQLTDCEVHTGDTLTLEE